MRHSDITVDDAFQRFRASANSRGHSGVDERAHPEAFGSRVSTLHQGDAALRLVWDGKEETLRLEITHGPDSPTGWLDLYEASRSGDQILHDQEDVGFESAVEHGLDLMDSERDVGAA